MNSVILAADIASRVQEMKRDSVTNNADMLQRLIEQEINRSQPKEDNANQQNESRSN